MFILDVSVSIEIGKDLLLELSRELTITVSDLGYLLIDFCLEALNNCFFILNIFIIILKNLSNFLFAFLFNNCFGVISFYLVLGIISIPSKF